MINFKLRFKNKATLSAIAGTLILLAQQLGLKLPDNIEGIVNTILILLVWLGVIIDPTTKRLADSIRALNYDEPLDEKKGK
ncbi:holin [Streptococcus phage 7201]|uniref:ORF43 n=1 Tax=Streptococcus phage 7201 TaxID=2905727 RepID=Q9MCJ1_9CAUD|nr:holin [Streptococcus phage 7201]AAF43535.1 ORF43 [Streptococcus phage 7201]